MSYDMDMCDAMTHDFGEGLCKPFRRPHCRIEERR